MPEQRPGDLGHDAGAVAGLVVARERAAMLDARERGQARLEDAVLGPALPADDEADAARAQLDLGVIGNNIVLSALEHGSEA